MNFRLTILGSASALPVVGKYPTACVLNVHEQFFLIDAGEGVQKQLIRYGIPLHKLNNIFITHLHGDHLFGLFGLVSTLGLTGREHPLHIYAPAPLERIMDSMDPLFSDMPYPIEYHTVDTERCEPIFENKAMTVTAIPLSHRVPACGYLFREKIPPLNVSKDAITELSLTLEEICAAKNGLDIIRDGKTIPNERIAYRPYEPRSFAFCSDTAYSETVVDAVHGVDLLYHEATFASTEAERAERTGHSTARQAATVASRAGAERLVIGHFSSRYKDNHEMLVQEAREVFPETYPGEQGCVFEIKAKCVRH